MLSRGTRRPSAHLAQGTAMCWCIWCSGRSWEVVLAKMHTPVHCMQVPVTCGHVFGGFVAAATPTPVLACLCRGPSIAASHIQPPCSLKISFALRMPGCGDGDTALVLRIRVRGAGMLSAEAVDAGAAQPRSDRRTSRGSHRRRHRAHQWHRQGDSGCLGGQGSPR